MATKSKSGSQQRQAGEANLGQKEARKARDSDASLRQMGDKAKKTATKAESPQAGKTRKSSPK